MNEAIASFFSGLVLFLGGVFTPPEELDFGAFDDPFISVQLASNPSNGDCLTTDGTDNIWDTCGGSGASSPIATSTGETAGNLAYWTTTNATPATLGKIATTTLSFSGPFRGFSALGKLVGGSDSTLTWTGLATTTQPSSSNLLVSNGGAGVFGVATTSLTINPPLTTSGTPGSLVGGSNLTIDIDDISSGDLDLTDITVSTFTNDAGYITDLVADLVATSSAETASYVPFWTSSAATPALLSGGENTFAYDATLNKLTVSNASTTNLSVTGLTSALTLAGSSGIIGEYAGTGCTNQVVEDLDAAGAANCISINNGYWSGTDLSVANGGTGVSTFTSSQLLYGNGTAALSSVATGTISAGTGISLSATAYAILNALQIAVDQAANFAWTGVHDFGGGVIEIPNGTNPTVDAIGEFALDTTNMQLVFATSTTAGSPAVISQHYYASFSYATSTAWTGTTTIPLGPAYIGEEWKGIQCFTDAGTLQVSVNDGTNRMNFLNASTTVGTVGLTTNNLFTAGEKRYVDIGTPASSPTRISCTVSKLYGRL